MSRALFGNVFLDPLDHYVKRTLRVPGYVRYADDFVLFSDSLDQLHAMRKLIQQKLWALRLSLHENKSVISPTRCGLKFLGFRVFPTHIQLTKENVRRLRRRLRVAMRTHAAGELEIEAIRKSILAWWGHAQSWNLLWQIVRGYPLLQVK